LTLHSHRRETVLFVFFDAQRGHYLQNAAFLGSIAVQAVVVQAIYLRSGSVWPCAVFHLSWNTWNETILGDVYAGAPGLLSGQFWVFNGEGPVGLLLNGAVALWLLHGWQSTRRSSLAVKHPVPVSVPP
jgi:hypothetical protein